VPESVTDLIGLALAAGVAVAARLGPKDRAG
jgi:hypothetical protein